MGSSKDRLEDEIYTLKEKLDLSKLNIAVLLSHLDACWDIIKEYAEHEYLTPETFEMRERLMNYYRFCGLKEIEKARKQIKAMMVD